jgi:hypothetical protein
MVWVSEPGGAAPPPITHRGDNRRTGELFLGLLALAILFLASVSYFYSATIVFHYWTGASYQNFAHFAIYAVGVLVLLAIVSRVFGFLAGVGVGLIAILPVVHSMMVDTAFTWIVFRAEASRNATGLLRLGPLAAVLLVHGVLAWNVARGGRAFRAQPGWWWPARGMPGRVGLLALVTLLVCLTVAHIVALRNVWAN